MRCSFRSTVKVRQTTCQAIHHLLTPICPWFLDFTIQESPHTWVGPYCYHWLQIEESGDNRRTNSIENCVLHLAGPRPLKEVGSGIKEYIESLYLSLRMSILHLLLSEFLKTLRFSDILSDVKSNWVENVNFLQKRPALDPWVGKIPWRTAWQPTPVLSSLKSHGQRSLAGYGHRVSKSRLSMNQLSSLTTEPTNWTYLASGHL